MTCTPRGWRKASAGGGPPADEAVATITQGLSSLGPDAHNAAIYRIGQIVSQQSNVMAFADVFYLLTGLFFLLVFATPLMRRPAPLPAGAGGH